MSERESGSQQRKDELNAAYAATQDAKLFKNSLLTVFLPSPNRIRQRPKSSSPKSSKYSDVPDLVEVSLKFVLSSWMTLPGASSGSFFSPSKRNEERRSSFDYRRE